MYLRITVFVVFFSFLAGAVLEERFSPWQKIQAKIFFYINGHPLEEPTSLIEKIFSDLNAGPERWQIKDQKNFIESYNKFEPLTGNLFDLHFSEWPLKVFRKTSSKPLDKEIGGFLLLSYAKIDGGYKKSLILVDQSMRIVSVIPLPKVTPSTSLDRVLNNKKPRLHVFATPSGQKARSSGNSLVAIDLCGNIQASIEAKNMFHHFWYNDLDKGANTFFVLDGNEFVELQNETLTEVRRFNIESIMKANPEFSIFEPRLAKSRLNRWTYDTLSLALKKDRSGGHTENAVIDPFHFNDIDIYRGQNDVFEEGDIVFSSRSLNLVVIIDKTLKIKGYISGLTSRQHDPDFVSSSQISVYDNDFHRNESSIKYFSFQKNSPHPVNVSKQAFDFKFQQFVGGQHSARKLTSGSNIITFDAGDAAAVTDANGNLSYLFKQIELSGRRLLKIDILDVFDNAEFKYLNSFNCDKDE